MLPSKLGDLLIARGFLLVEASRVHTQRDIERTSKELHNDRCRAKCRAKWARDRLPVRSHTPHLT
jgi:hypothetical protein